MEHYDDKIERALQYLKQPSILSPTGYSPIVYLVYKPEDVMIIHDMATTLLPPKADYYGFKPVFVSMGELIDQFINNHEYRDIWTDPTVNEAAMFNSIKQEIISAKFFENSILKIQQELNGSEHPLLVLKDIEMLHPFYMMGVVENRIYNEIHIPILVLYPGETQGNARSFLGIYNQDGNYRSINF
jgi:hypothetical protein